MLHLSEENVIPIQALDAGIQNIVLKVRLLEKGEVKEYGKNTDKAGKLMPIEIGDSYGSSIRAVLFNQAIDDFGHILEVGNCYFMGEGKVRYANKNYSSHSNPLEISFGVGMECKRIDDDKSIPHQKYSLVDFGEFERIISRGEGNKYINIIGFVSDVEDSQSITTKKGNQTDRRNIYLSNIVNKEAVKIQATLWGNKAKNLNFKQGDILLLKNIRLSNFRGVSIQISFQTVIKVNPTDCPNESKELLEFFGDGSKKTSKSLTTAFTGEPTAYNTLSDIEGLDIFNHPSQSVFVRAEISHIPHDKNMKQQQEDGKPKREPWYMACQNEVRSNNQFQKTRKCNKKVNETGNQTYFCESCQMDVTNNCKRRYVLSMKISDHTNSRWITFFDEPAITVLGVDADTLYNLKKTNFEEYLKVMNKPIGTEYLLKINVQQKQDSNDGQLDCRVGKAFKIDFERQISKSLKFIKMYEKK